MVFIIENILVVIIIITMSMGVGTHRWSERVEVGLFLVLTSIASFYAAVCKQANTKIKTF